MLRLAADAVHRDGQRLVRFLARWSRSDMAPVAKRFTISLAGSTSSSGTGSSAVLISSRPRSVQSWRFWLSIRSVYSWNVCEALLPHGVLQLRDGLRIVQVILAAGAPVIIAADGQFGLEIGQRAEGVSVLAACASSREHVQPDAFDARRGAGEVLLDQLLVEPDGFEDLRAAIALQRGDAHLREGLQQALVDGLDVSSWPCACLVGRLRSRARDTD